MTRQERRLFFEQLVAMREAYRREAHQGLDMTMESAMAVVQRLLQEDGTAAAKAAARPSATNVDLMAA